MGKKYIIELPETDSEFDFASIQPYTEPDLEQVKADVWKCAGKIAYMYSEERKKVFGENLIQNIYDIYSASEAVEKIRQYEQKEEIIDPDKNKVEALANDIGIHKLYALVKEIRGE